MTYQLLQGDSAIVLESFEPDSIDLTVTSPPYDNLRTYNGFVFDFETIARELYRVTKPGGVAVWVVGDATINGSETLTSFKQALFFKECGFNVETMIYEKPSTGACGNNNFYWQAFEFMFIFVKGSPKTHNLIKDIKTQVPGKVAIADRRDRDGINRHGRTVTRKEYATRTNVWRISSGYNQFTGHDHPAKFPEALARDHILSWSNPGDTVLDCFAGSGTTLKMAQMLGRKSIGIEISAEYCEIIKKRMEATPTPLFVEQPAKQQESVTQNALI